jgi:hypothetical protein
MNLRSRKPLPDRRRFLGSRPTGAASLTSSAYQGDTQQLFGVAALGLSLVPEGWGTDPSATGGEPNPGDNLDINPDGGTAPSGPVQPIYPVSPGLPLEPVQPPTKVTLPYVPRTPVRRVPVTPPPVTPPPTVQPSAPFRVISPGRFTVDGVSITTTWNRCKRYFLLRQGANMVSFDNSGAMQTGFSRGPADWKAFAAATVRNNINAMRANSPYTGGTFYVEDCQAPGANMGPVSAAVLNHVAIPCWNNTAKSATMTRGTITVRFNGLHLEAIDNAINGWRVQFTTAFKPAPGYERKRGFVQRVQRFFTVNDMIRLVSANQPCLPSTVAPPRRPVPIPVTIPLVPAPPVNPVAPVNNTPPPVVVNPPVPDPIIPPTTVLPAGPSLPPSGPIPVIGIDPNYVPLLTGPNVASNSGGGGIMTSLGQDNGNIASGGGAQIDSADEPEVGPDIPTEIIVAGAAAIWLLLLA